MRRPTGFTIDNPYVALDIDMWCPDVVVVVVVCGWGALVGGGGVWVDKHLSFNNHVWLESEIVGGEFDPEPVVEIDHELIFYSHSPSFRWFVQ